MQSLYNLVDAANSVRFQAFPAIYKFINKLSFHVGEYKMSARTSDFSEWVLCDGRSMSRETYSELFSVIGVTFGFDDLDTFRLPDYRGRAIAQPGQGFGLTNRLMGVYVGAETHVLTENQVPAHTHIGVTESNGTHTHTLIDPGHTHTQTTVNDDFNNSGTNPPGFTQDSAGNRTWNNINSAQTGISINTSGLHTHTFTTNSIGGGLAHNNMQPTLFGANVFIYTGVSPEVY